MKKMVTLLLLIFLVGEILYAAENRDQEPPAEKPDARSGSTTTRTIVDLAGNRVDLLSGKDLKRVVIIAPPLVSTFASLNIPDARIVGAHKTAFHDANHELLDRVLPYWKDIPTGFLTGYTANTEELLKLRPDVILVYGNFQKEGLQGVKVPVIDFSIMNHDNQVWSVSIEKLMKEIFEMDNGETSVEDGWKKANARVGRFLPNVQVKKLKGLMIMSNTKDKIMVRGGGTYGDDWLLKSGLTNVAGDLKGDNKEVTMEQIYAWDPDIIYVFRGRPASEYLSDRIEKQNWSFVKAYKNRAIYDCPKGMMNWGAPNVDSPLMLQWMVSKNYQEALGEEKFLTIMKSYYKELFSIELSDNLIDSILCPKGNG